MPKKPKPKTVTPKPPKKKRKPINVGAGRGVGGGAPFGSKNAEKFRTPAERQAVWKLYLDHIGAGYSGKAFHDPCTEETVDNMRKRYPTEFDADELKSARASGIMVWEKLGMYGAAGKFKNFSASAWIFNMKNRLGWKDRQEIGLDKDTRAVFRLRMGKDLGGEKDDKE